MITQGVCKNYIGGSVKITQGVCKIYIGGSVIITHLINYRVKKLYIIVMPTTLKAIFNITIILQAPSRNKHPLKITC